jgi:sulfoxide reductase heme-binding subunit YedZ
LCCALLPLVWLVVAAATNQLGANPAEALIRSTGRLDAAGAVPGAGRDAAARRSPCPQLARFRRMLGCLCSSTLLHLC